MQINYINVKKIPVRYTACENVKKCAVVNINYVKNTTGHEGKGKRVLYDSAALTALGLRAHLLHITIFCTNSRRDITKPYK
jgi:hypothetical protein